MAVKPEKFYPPPAGNFSKRRVEKTYLVWKVGGGGTESLNQKIDSG